MNTNPTATPFHLRKIILPLLIGLGASVYVLVSNVNYDALRHIQWSNTLLYGLLFAAITVALRDAAYIWRIREITGRKLSWYRSFETIVLWEFGSAITPGAVGGIALALFILKREGISFGRSTATVMLTTLLDNMAFVVVFALLYLLLGENMFLVTSVCPDIEGNGILEGIRHLIKISIIGWVVYALSALLLGIALFVVPNRASMLLSRLASLRMLRRFAESIQRFADEILLASTEFKKMPLRLFGSLMTATLFAWLGRYLLANALIFAFADVSINHLEVLARQYVLWVFIVIPSTPGASGLAELSFIALNCSFIKPGLTGAVAVVWRLYSYYLYLIVGAIVLPKWLMKNADN